MPALTKTQLEHAKMRVSEAKEQFLATRTEALGAKPEVPQFTDAQMLEMVANGAAKLNRDKNYYGYLTGAFTYPPLDPDAEAAAEAWGVAYTALYNEANAIERGLIDELVMSPDGVAALTRIAAAFA